MEGLYFYDFIKLIGGIAFCINDLKSFWNFIFMEEEVLQGPVYFKCLWKVLFLWLYQINRGYSKYFILKVFYERGAGAHVF